jgi:hypothetical protein
MGPQGQSGWVQKMLTPLGFDPWTIQPTSNYIWGGGNNIGGAREYLHSMLMLSTRWRQVFSLYSILPPWKEPLLPIQQQAG